MSQVLDASGLLHFTMLRPVLLGARFENRGPFISLVFQFFLGPRQTADIESVDTGVRLYNVTLRRVRATVIAV